LGNIESGCVLGVIGGRSNRDSLGLPRFSYFSRQAAAVLSHTLEIPLAPVRFLCLHAPVRVGHNNFLITLSATGTHGGGRMCADAHTHTSGIIWAADRPPRARVQQVEPRENCALCGLGTPTPKSGINNSRRKRCVDYDYPEPCLHLLLNAVCSEHIRNTHKQIYLVEAPQQNIYLIFNGIEIPLTIKFFVSLYKFM
jgi:hypothetical protein